MEIYGTDGVSARSVTARTLVDYDAPAAVINLTVVPSDKSLQASWVSVPRASTAPLTGYRATVTDTVTNTQTSVTQPELAFALSGLINGHEFELTVVAYVPGGDSAPASASGTPFAVTSPPVPTVPTPTEHQTGLPERR